MRARTIWCTTLLLLCHPLLRAQAVTTELPQNPTPGAPLSPGAGPSAEPTPTNSTAPSENLLEGPLGSPTDIWSDPAFAHRPIPGSVPFSAGEPPPLLPDLLLPPASDSEAASAPERVAVPLDAPPSGVPVHIEAASQRKVGELYYLDGSGKEQVFLHYKQYLVHADHAVYNRDTAELSAQGHVTIDGGPMDEHIVATHGVMNLEKHTGHFYQAVGTLGVRAFTHDRYVFTAPNPFNIAGEEIVELGQDHWQVLHGTMTSCRLPRPDWKFLSSVIDVRDNEARTRNSIFELGPVPILFFPYASHPTEKNHRQSGFLIPIFGSSTTRGFIAGEEVYLVLGRSADITFGSEYFSKRGFSPLVNLRYRGAGADFGSVQFHALFDRLPGTENQGGVDLLADARHDLSPETRAVTDIEYLSSYVYRQAFEASYTAAINSEAKSQAFITHEHDGWAASGRFDRYQDFRSDTSGDEIRVLHVPEASVEAVDRPVGSALGPLLWGGEADAVGLSRAEPGFQTSRVVPRVDLYPHLALPLSAEGWTLRGEAGVRETFYAKSQTPGAPGQVPVQNDATLNRGAFEGEVSLRPPALERDFAGPLVRHWFNGGELRHTIEPEFQYRYVTGINNFADTLRFDTTDVMSNTNEAEYGLTQHLYLRHLRPKPCKGDEALGPSDLCGGGTLDWITWTVAQKYFFDPTFGGAAQPGARNVLSSTLDLTGVAFLAEPRSSSPVISRLRLRTTSATDFEWDLDYDPKKGRMNASNVSAGYRYRDLFLSAGDYKLHTLGTADGIVATSATLPSAVSDFNQLRLAAIYGSPVKHGLSAGMNLGYDFEQKQVQYLGVQSGWNRDCCGLTVEMRRYSLGAVRDDTQYLFSFTLAGVGTAGNLTRITRVF